MRLDGAAALAAAITTAVVAVVLLGWFWERGRRWLRLAVATLAVLSLTAAVGLQVNRMTEAYPAAAPAADPPYADPPDGEAPAGGTSDGGTSAAAAAGRSRMVTYTVPGTLSGLNLQMYAYLPAAYQTGRTRFPVIEALHGYPGSPRTWLRKIGVQAVLDAEIAAGRMAPTVVLFPFQTPQQLLDTECTDLAGGPQTETFLTRDVPAFAAAHLRVRTDRAAWGLTGYSAGGFCATNLLLRNPGRYAAAAGLSGYASPGIAIGDGTEHTTNNALWRLTHLPQPAVALWLGWAADDRTSKRDSTALAAVARAPMTITTGTVAHGGHSSAVWRQMAGPAFDWLSAHLARPLP